MAAGTIRYGTAPGRWVLASAVLGSSVVFLDGTVVNVALPAIAEDLDADIGGLQWTLDGYLVALTAFLLLGGSLGDIYGRRRIYLIGLAAFTAASALCAVAPTVGALTAGRIAQGLGGALLVPGSLALISASFRAQDRSHAVGTWSGLAGVASAIGPLFGGWLIDAWSWRLIFFLNVPVAAAAAWFATQHVPESLDEDAVHRLDFLGALLVATGLAGLTFGLIEEVLVVALAGAAIIIAFVVAERTVKAPMLPLELFRSGQFSGANLTTLFVYGGLGGSMFLLMLQLQGVLDYGAAFAGASLLPVTLIMLVASPRVGMVAQRIGPRPFMTGGPIVAGVGMILLGRLAPGDGYLAGVLPGAILLGVGLALTVAPLTAAVLGAVDDHHVGVGSAVNNAVARLGGLLAVAVVPLLDTYRSAMYLSGLVCAIGGVVAATTVTRARRVAPTPHASILQPCHDASRAEAA